MESHTFFIDEEIKRRAYKELIQELEKDYEHKCEEVEKLEIEYSKKWFSCESIANNHDRYTLRKCSLDEFRKKIEKERDNKEQLREERESLINKFQNIYGNLKK